ncbi:DUF461 domain-containing protein [Streptomyces sp. NPDC005899]|uniref:DUF461 domain-containing protein n=1 Tax=Streptomyces sp. NPDC005899 TaxID=3155716 RepID=UPI0033F90A75
MSRSLRHGAFAATALVFTIASLSACSAGNDAQTLQVRPDNAATAVDNIKIQNANVVTQPGHETEGPATVNATLFNDGTKAEVLESVTLPGTSATVKLNAAKGKGPIRVPAGGRVILGGKGNASAVIENGRQAGSDGDVRNVVFTFSETGDVRLGALVVPASGYFEGFGPSTLPSPTPSKGSSPGVNPSESAGRQSDTPSDVESGAETQQDEDSENSAAH